MTVQNRFPSNNMSTLLTFDTEEREERTTGFHLIRKKEEVGRRRFPETTKNGLRLTWIPKNKRFSSSGESCRGKTMRNFVAGHVSVG